MKVTVTVMKAVFQEIILTRCIWAYLGWGNSLEGRRPVRDFWCHHYPQREKLGGGSGKERKWQKPSWKAGVDIIEWKF